MQNSEVLFSIIVASYNYEDYIKATLDSISEQTYKNFEVIVVDDGSKDNSLEVIKNYCEKYPNFYLYTHENNENRGLKDSILLGLSKAKGEYIAFCESDDYWAPEKLEDVYKSICENPDAALLANGIKTVPSREKDEKGIAYCRKFLLKNWRNYYYKMDRAQLFLTFSAVTIKKSVLESLDFNSYIPAWLDLWLFTQITLNYKCVYIDKILTFWRIHSDSYCKTDNSFDKKFKYIRMLKLMLFKKYPLKFLVKELLNPKNIISFENISNNSQSYKQIKILYITFLLRRGGGQVETSL